MLKLVGPDQLLYGSDYPFAADWVVHGLAQMLASSDLLDPSEQLMMMSGNAKELFGRLRP